MLPFDSQLLDLEHHQIFHDLILKELILYYQSNHLEGNYEE